MGKAYAMTKSAVASSQRRAPLGVASTGFVEQQLSLVMFSRPTALTVRVLVGFARECTRAGISYPGFAAIYVTEQHLDQT